jgi:hypothetical protein
MSRMFKILLGFALLSLAMALAAMPLRVSRAAGSSPEVRQTV